MEIKMQNGIIQIILSTANECDLLLSNPKPILDSVRKRRLILERATKKDKKFTEWWNNEIVPNVRGYNQYWDYIAKMIQGWIYVGDKITKSQLYFIAQSFSDEQLSVTVKGLKLVGLLKKDNS